MCVCVVVGVCMLFGVLLLRWPLDRTQDCKTVDLRVTQCYCRQGVSDSCRHSDSLGIGSKSCFTDEPGPQRGSMSGSVAEQGLVSMCALLGIDHPLQFMSFLH